MDSTTTATTRREQPIGSGRHATDGNRGDASRSAYDPGAPEFVPRWGRRRDGAARRTAHGSNREGVVDFLVEVYMVPRRIAEDACDASGSLLAAANIIERTYWREERDGAAALAQMIASAYHR